MTCRLIDAAEPVREALERLAESPRALRCFVVIEDAVVGRFVQFCTPPLPSAFGSRTFASCPGPLIYDGTGTRGKNVYEPVQVSCDVPDGVEVALSVLAKYLPPEAELYIIEESTRRERPS
jgi:hypothetical protein